MAPPGQINEIENKRERTIIYVYKQTSEKNFIGLLTVTKWILKQLESCAVNRPNGQEDNHETRKVDDGEIGYFKRWRQRWKSKKNKRGRVKKRKAAMKRKKASEKKQKQNMYCCEKSVKLFSIVPIGRLAIKHIKITTSTLSTLVSSLNVKKKKKKKKKTQEEEDEAQDQEDLPPSKDDRDIWCEHTNIKSILGSKIKNFYGVVYTDGQSVSFVMFREKTRNRNSSDTKGNCVDDESGAMQQVLLHIYLYT